MKPSSSFLIMSSCILFWHSTGFVTNHNLVAWEVISVSYWRLYQVFRSKDYWNNYGARWSFVGACLVFKYVAFNLLYKWALRSFQWVISVQYLLMVSIKCSWTCFCKFKSCLLITEIYFSNVDFYFLLDYIPWTVTCQPVFKVPCLQDLWKK